MKKVPPEVTLVLNQIESYALFKRAQNETPSILKQIASELNSPYTRIHDTIITRAHVPYSDRFWDLKSWIDSRLKLLNPADKKLFQESLEKTIAKHNKTTKVKIKTGKSK